MGAFHKNGVLLVLFTISLTACEATKTTPSRALPNSIMPTDDALSVLSQIDTFATQYSQRCEFVDRGVMVNDRGPIVYSNLSFRRTYGKNVVSGEREILTVYATGAACQYEFAVGELSLFEKSSSALASLGARYNQCDFKVCF